MKKFTRTGKKVLSVFLAVLMVMTAWVFVGPEAEAATAGGYYVSLIVETTNTVDVGDNADLVYTSSIPAEKAPTYSTKNNV